jgi:hypothetical protein
MESHRGAGTCRHRLILESHSHWPFLKYRRPPGRSRGISRILDLPHVYQGTQYFNCGMRNVIALARELK